MMLKRLIAILILSTTIFSMFGCDALKKGGGHGNPEDTGTTEAPEAKPRDMGKVAFVD